MHLILCSSVDVTHFGLIKTTTDINGQDIEVCIDTGVKMFMALGLDGSEELSLPLTDFSALKIPFHGITYQSFLDYSEIHVNVKTLGKEMTKDVLVRPRVSEVKCVTLGV